jgi:hypothetical protein
VTDLTLLEKYHALQEECLRAQRALITVYEGMGSHHHWDPTGRSGVGCDTCIRQHEAREKAWPEIVRARTALNSITIPIEE